MNTIRDGQISMLGKDSGFIHIETTMSSSSGLKLDKQSEFWCLEVSRQQNFYRKS